MRFWVIGLPRCGNASVCQAISMLGIPVLYNPKNWDETDGYNVVGGPLISAHWRELQAMYPTSKFILPTRNMFDWIASQVDAQSFWTGRDNFSRYHRIKLCGTNTPRDLRALHDAWGRHHVDIREAIPRNKLLLLKTPFRWRPLCRFMKVRTVPEVDFPWVDLHNSSNVRV